VTTDPRFNRHFDKLTTEYCRARLERLDERIADPENARRLDYLFAQRQFWEKQLPHCYRREGLLRS